MRGRIRKRQKNKRLSRKRSGDDFSRFVARLVVGDPRVKIVYFIPHAHQDLARASPFGFFTPGIHRSAEMIKSACLLPGDVREPFTRSANILHLRLLRTLWRTSDP